MKRRYLLRTLLYTPFIPILSVKKKEEICDLSNWVMLKDGTVSTDIIFNKNFRVSQRGIINGKNLKWSADAEL